MGNSPKGARCERVGSEMGAGYILRLETLAMMGGSVLFGEIGRVRWSRAGQVPAAASTQFVRELAGRVRELRGRIDRVRLLGRDQKKI